MQTITDAPDQPLLEAKAKLRNLLTEYVATDLQQTIRSGFGDAQKQVEKGLIDIKGEAEEMRKKIHRVWEDRWEAWEERLDKLPVALQEQFIAELSGPLAQQRDLLQAQAEFLTGQMNALSRDLSGQSEQQRQEMQARSAEFVALLQQQEQRATEHAGAFFAHLTGEIETTTRTTATLHNALTEHAQKTTADLQEFRQTSEMALQALPAQMASIVTTAQGNQAGQISNLTNQIVRMEQRERKTNMLVRICLAINAIVLLILLSHL